MAVKWAPPELGRFAGFIPSKHPRTAKILSVHGESSGLIIPVNV
jgi:hypothetical protein